MKKDKFRLFLMGLITMAVLITAGLYGFIMVSSEEMTLGKLIPIVIPLIVIVFMLFFIIRRYRDIKQGMPLEDERSIKIITQAAAKSFYVSLYWLLAISWFEPFFADKLFGLDKLDASQTVGGGIAGMAIFFFVFWLYYNKKGTVI